MPVQPSTPAQFQAAQERLRDAFGQLATFHVPQAVTYAPGTAVDPELGIALDPTKQPLATYADVHKNVSVVHRPIGRGGHLEGTTVTTAAGVFSGESLVLILNLADFGDVEEATEVTVLNDRYKIKDWKPDGIGAIQRWLVFCEDLA